MTKTIAVVLKGYPRLSETFIAQEILGLETAGVEVLLVSLRLPTDRKTHPVHDAIRASILYLPEYLHQEPVRVLRAWRKMRKTSCYREARNYWWQDLKRDITLNRIRRFGQALVLAAELPEGFDLLYAHFLHTPASVTRYTSLLRQIPWCVSAHAKDIWTSPDWEITEKLAHCQWLTTCTRANFDHLRRLAEDPAKVALNYHGLDTSRFPDAPTDYSARDGSDAGAPVRILSVGRMVAKKGYAELLDALARLPRSLHWELTHIGGGPLLAPVQQQAKALGFADHIRWLGPQSQDVVVENYRQADFFALNCRIDNSGDRDGLPNVLVEAQSQGLAILSTRLSGVPELVENEVNGLLVQPDDGVALSKGLDRLIRDPQLRQQLGDAGRKVVRDRFEMNANFRQLYRMIADTD